MEQKLKTRKITKEKFIKIDTPMHTETCAVITIKDLIDNFDKDFTINFINKINSLVENNINFANIESLINATNMNAAQSICNILIKIEKHCIYNTCKQQFIMYDPVQQDFKRIWNQLSLKEKISINNIKMYMHNNNPIDIYDVVYYRNEDIITNKDVYGVNKLIKDNDISIAYTDQEVIDSIEYQYLIKNALKELNDLSRQLSYNQINHLIENAKMLNYIRKGVNINDDRY